MSTSLCPLFVIVLCPLLIYKPPCSRMSSDEQDYPQQDFGAVAGVSVNPSGFVNAQGAGQRNRLDFAA